MNKEVKKIILSVKNTIADSVRTALKSNDPELLKEVITALISSGGEMIEFGFSLLAILGIGKETTEKMLNDVYNHIQKNLNERYGGAQVDRNERK